MIYKLLYTKQAQKDAKKLASWNSYLSPKNLKNIYYISKQRSENKLVLMSKELEATLLAKQQ